MAEIPAPTNVPGTTAHTQAPGGHGSTVFPPFQSETFPSQLLWLGLCFLALYFLMARLALPRLGSVLEARRARIAGDLGEAQRLRSESEAVAAGYEKSLSEARSRAQAIANETRERLLAESERNRRALEDKLNAHLAESEATIAQTKSAAMMHVREVAVDTAATIVERLTGAAPPRAAIAQAVEDVLQRRGTEHV